jgi:hypothetical protein
MCIISPTIRPGCRAPSAPVIEPRTSSALGLAGLLGGYSKASAPPPETTSPLVINATDFRPAFATASPEIKAQVDQVMMSIQSSVYNEALKGLAKLAANPALTEPQRKAVSDLTDHVKRKMAALSGPPP